MGLSKWTFAAAVFTGGLMLALPAAAETLYVSATSLNCRAAPETSAVIVTKLSRGASIRILQRRVGWVEVQPGPISCWVSEQFLTSEALTSPSYLSDRSASSSSSKRKAAKRSARSTGKAAPARRGKKRRSTGSYYGSGCPCSGSRVCIGPRGGRYCITSGGNKRYGVGYESWLGQDPVVKRTVSIGAPAALRE